MAHEKPHGIETDKFPRQYKDQDIPIRKKKSSAAEAQQQGEWSKHKEHDRGTLAIIQGSNHAASTDPGRLFHFADRKLGHDFALDVTS
jgi:hypothetical protein